MANSSKSCRICGAQILIGPDDLLFYEKVSPRFGNVVCELPPPSACQDCRLQQRLSFRNERHLYHRPSALSGKRVLGMHSEASPYKVVSMEEWLSDDFDGLSYGQPYDYSKPFLQQLKELSLRVPHRALNYTRAENSDYTNYCLGVKDCYWSFGVTDSERCLYTKTLNECREVLDSIALVRCEACYEGISASGCTRCFWFKDCHNCSDCHFVEACESCQNCAQCYGLYRKQYYVKNKFVGKDGYEKWRADNIPFTTNSVSILQSETNGVSLNMPRRGCYILNSEDCTGDFIVNSRNCKHCFDIKECEDSKFLFWTPKGINSQDCSFNSPDGVTECYQACSTLGNRCMATFMVWACNETYFSIECLQSSNIFGCVGLNRKQHCILNVQYSKAEYEKLATAIAGELSNGYFWGEYLPPELALFPYNDSIANEYFPLDMKSATALGWQWRTEEERAPAEAIRVPKDKVTWSKDWCRKVLMCQATGRPYKVTPYELNFYEEHGLPIPSLCADERHSVRLAKKNPLLLWNRKCPKMGTEFWSSFGPNRKEIVWSEEAFREFQMGS